MVVKEGVLYTSHSHQHSHQIKTLENNFWLKLADKVSFNLNISSKMGDKYTVVSCFEVKREREKKRLCYLLFNLVW